MTTEKRRRSSRRTPVRRKAFPWKYVAGGGFLVVCAIISLFVVSSDDVVEYNDKTVVIVQSMDKVYEKYCQELFKYSSGQEADVAFMTKERKRIEKKVKQYRSKLKALTVPDCDLCRTFHKCLIAYVKNAVKFYVKFKEIQAFIKQHNPGSEEDIEKVTAMLAPLGKEEEETMEKVSKAQKKMVAKYDLTLN